MPKVSRSRSASATISAAGAKPTMCETRTRSVKPPSSSLTDAPSVCPRASQMAMSTAAFATGLPTVRSMRARATSRSRMPTPTSCGPKWSATIERTETWVSPYVNGRGGASAVPTTPSSVCTRTSTCSAAVISPLAKRRGFLYGIEYGIASMRLIFMRRASHADQ